METNMKDISDIIEYNYSQSTINVSYASMRMFNNRNESIIVWWHRPTLPSVLTPLHESYFYAINYLNNTYVNMLIQQKVIFL